MTAYAARLDSSQSSRPGPENAKSVRDRPVQAQVKGETHRVRAARAPAR
jgi:hypothetical protein